MNFSENATVVVVHGAWADGSSWQAVVRPLEERGLRDLFSVGFSSRPFSISSFATNAILAHSNAGHGP